MDERDQALVSLGKQLIAANYYFTTITPLSHRRVNGREGTNQGSLEAVFGWNRPFACHALQDDTLSLLEKAGELSRDGELLRSGVRFSRLGDQLFVHSAFPTEAADCVFFGPDTYRFARALRYALAGYAPPQHCTVVDIGCGSGAGGLHAAFELRDRAHIDLVLSDVNPKAVRYSRINAVINDCLTARIVLSDMFDNIDERVDVIISNPPYLVDKGARTYRHGGGALGFDLALRIASEGMNRLQSGGRLVLYTGAAVVDGVDQFLLFLRPRLDWHGCRYTYEEIDPDVFGEELDEVPYRRVDRIAAVILTVDVERTI